MAKRLNKNPNEILTTKALPEHKALVYFRVQHTRTYRYGEFYAHDGKGWFICGNEWFQVNRVTAWYKKEDKRNGKL